MDTGGGTPGPAACTSWRRPRAVVVVDESARGHKERYPNKRQSRPRESVQRGFRDLDRTVCKHEHYGWRDVVAALHATEGADHE